MNSCPHQIFQSVWKDIIQNGSDSISSLESMNSGKKIKEVFNVYLNFPDPTCRLILGDFKNSYFNPSYAAARAIFLLTGSNLLSRASFYTKGVSRFTDDNITIPGSSYGYKIFGKFYGDINAFEKIARLLEERKNTKRGFLPILLEENFLTLPTTKDFPCCIGMHFYIRKNKLYTITLMRANDALKLLPYNYFEFSLVGECMASRLGIKYASHYHSSISMHLRGEGITNVTKFLHNNDYVSARIRPIKVFNEELRQEINRIESYIQQKSNLSLEEIIKITNSIDSGPWVDLLLAAYFAAALKDNKKSSFCYEASDFIKDKSNMYPLLTAACSKHIIG